MAEFSIELARPLAVSLPPVADTALGTIGQRIRDLREKLKYSREKLAEMVKLSQKTLVNYENGTYPPKADDLLNIAEALDTTASYLIGDTDNPSRRPETLQARSEGPATMDQMTALHDMLRLVRRERELIEIERKLLEQIGGKKQ